MKLGRIAVFALALGCVAPLAQAQHRYTTEALVGLGNMPFAVRDLALATETWERLGFSIKPGAQQANGILNNFVKLADGSSIELLTVPAAVDDVTTRYLELLEVSEGPVAFTFQAQDLAQVAFALGGTRYKYGSVSRTVAGRGFEYVRFDPDIRAKDDAAYVIHPNGATAMSRLWIATTKSAGEDLQRLLVALGSEATGAKVYAPEAVQTKVATVNNGEVLILPRTHQLMRDRPIIGATFEVEDLERLRSRLSLFEVPYTAGGTEDRSVIIAPEFTHGIWVEFRE